MGGKLPYFAFYPSDWLGAGTLRRASHATKGFYIDLLCVMHDCEHRGKLEANGVPWTEDEITRSINGDPSENRTHLRWLITHGILSKDEKGTVYSRRMVKDEDKRVKGSINGKKGGGNPQLSKSDPSSTTFIGASKAKSRAGLKEPLYSYSRDHNPESKDESSTPEPDRPPLPPERGDRAGEERGEEIRQVFDHYRTHHPRSFRQPQSSSDEWKRIRERLKEGFTVEDLRQAIDGCHVCPHNCGENSRNQKYQNLKLIMKDGGQVTRFMEEWENRGRPVLSEKNLRNQRAADQFLKMQGVNCAQ